jgi:hypothetical protein
MDKFIKRQNLLKWVLASLVGLAFVFELIRDCQRAGDFVGYINAGNAVLNGTPIYNDYLNTWPPFFAIFSVPLALVDAVSPLGIRLLWLIGILVSWYYIVKWTVKLTYNKTLSLKPNNNKASLWILDWSVFLPFLFVLRFIIDDLSNIQINSFLLLSCLYIIYCYRNNKLIIAGLVLGAIISLKVYPIFLLFYFIYKRAYRLTLITMVVVGVAILMSLAVFGWEVGLSYFGDWLHNKAMGDTILTHKNQSIFPWIEGLLTDQSRGLDIQYNIVSISAAAAKKVTYLVIGLVALTIAWLFRGGSNRYDSVGKFAFLLAAIPLLSPLAWKYYFVFLFPLLFIQFNNTFKKDIGGRLPKVLFIIGLMLAILSTDGLIGKRLSDVLEVYGCITWAAILFLLSFLTTYARPKTVI